MGTDPEMLLSLAKAGSRAGPGPAAGSSSRGPGGASTSPARPPPPLEAGYRRPDAGAVARGPPGHRPVPRPFGGGIRLLAPEGLRDDPLEPGAALPRHAAARPAAGDARSDGGRDDTSRPLIDRQSDRAAELAQPAGRPPRAGRAAGRGPGDAAGGLSRGDRPEEPRGPQLRGGRPRGWAAPRTASRTSGSGPWTDSAASLGDLL